MWRPKPSGRSEGPRSPSPGRSPGYSRPTKFCALKGRDIWDSVEIAPLQGAEPILEPTYPGLRPGLCDRGPSDRRKDRHTAPQPSPPPRRLNRHRSSPSHAEARPRGLDGGGGEACSGVVRVRRTRKRVLAAVVVDRFFSPAYRGRTHRNIGDARGFGMWRPKPSGRSEGPRSPSPGRSPGYSRPTKFCALKGRDIWESAEIAPLQGAEPILEPTYPGLRPGLCDRGPSDRRKDRHTAPPTVTTAKAPESASFDTVARGSASSRP
jgi:hypothetical protein